MELRSPLTSEQFNERLKKLCSENQLADLLINGNAKNMKPLGFQGLPKHLQKDGLKRMSIEQQICPYSGAITYYALNP